MAVEVTTPEDYMGDVIGDLNSRRGQIQAMEELQWCPCRQGAGAAVGDVRLRRRPSVGPDQANYSMVFDSYAEVPANVSKEIIAKATGQWFLVRVRGDERSEGDGPVSHWSGAEVATAKRNETNKTALNKHQQVQEDTQKWRRRSSSGRSRTSASGPSVTLTAAEPR